jgi:hypothetical protein
MSKPSIKHSINLSSVLMYETDLPTQISKKTTKWDINFDQEIDDIEMRDTKSPPFSFEPTIVGKFPEMPNLDFNKNITDQSESIEIESIEFENFEQIDTFDIRFLHEGSNLKLVEVCLLLLAFKNRFTLNNLCFECLLVLIHFFLPFGNNLPTSLKKLQKVISTNNEPMKLKRYCSLCQCEVADSTCQNRNCHTISSDFDTFHYISIKGQLKQNLQYFYEQLMSYKEDTNKFADITNSQHNKNFDSAHNYINLMLYSDGVRLRKNKKKFDQYF